MITYSEILKYSRQDWADIIKEDFEKSSNDIEPKELMNGYLKLWDEIRFLKPVQEKALKELNYNLLACIQLKRESENEN